MDGVQDGHTDGENQETGEAPAAEDASDPTAEDAPEPEAEPEANGNAGIAGTTQTESEVESESEEPTEAVTEEPTEAEKDTEQIVLDPTPEPLPTGQLAMRVGILALVLAAAAVAAVFIVRFLKKKKGKEDMLIDQHAGRVHTISPTESGGTPVKIEKTDPACPVRIGTVHDVGKRGNQQDAFGISDVEHADEFASWGILAVVADGMGGLSDGERMSRLVVVSMLSAFDESSPDMPPASTLLGLVNEANSAVNQELGAEKIGKCGSTLTAVMVKDQKLYWISVGDSHIYVYRAGKLVQLNHDHNYAAELDARVERGELTAEEALSDPQRAALTSYIGIGDLELIDRNENPIALEKNDRILLMSDGVYGTLPDDRIAELMEKPLKQSCILMDQAIREEGKKNQDNYTCVILEVV